MLLRIYCVRQECVVRVQNRLWNANLELFAPNDNIFCFDVLLVEQTTTSSVLKDYTHSNAVSNNPEKYKANKREASTQPCFVTFETKWFGHFPIKSDRSNHPLVEINYGIENFAGKPGFLRTTKRASLDVMSNDFARSINVTQTFRLSLQAFSWNYLRLKTVSTVHLSVRNPHWDSGNTKRLRTMFSLFTMKLQSIFPATYKRDIAVWLSHSHVLTFCL